MKDYPSTDAKCAECRHRFWTAGGCRCCVMKHRDRTIFRWRSLVVGRGLVGGFWDFWIRKIPL